MVPLRHQELTGLVNHLALNLRNVHFRHHQLLLLYKYLLLFLGLLSIKSQFHVSGSILQLEGYFSLILLSLDFSLIYLYFVGKSQLLSCVLSRVEFVQEPQ